MKNKNIYLQIYTKNKIHKNSTFKKKQNVVYFVFLWLSLFRFRFPLVHFYRFLSFSFDFLFRLYFFFLFFLFNFLNLFLSFLLNLFFFNFWLMKRKNLNNQSKYILHNYQLSQHKFFEKLNVHYSIFVLLKIYGMKLINKKEYFHD